jgi:hypothetical protein
MAKDYLHLVMRERALIETQLGFGMTASAIALGLGRSRSTVTREMHRNGWKRGSQGDIVVCVPINVRSGWRSGRGSLASWFTATPSGS